ncbi:RimK family alpha-L-glutamate ligase [Pontibacillus sp. HMF3514]|uniref:ATP-grasp domain-containing protein n=1 Tax=Pontibacillus sp. HMF3514 TaxID=2692425 RepID=UPI00131FAA01|nr:alpha-L-glutamate ligase [Pontibacillus sp. HMF3514]QHE53699.1 alpha-L-glutamate ligase [Pontibacillus sp. HMF3514]
MSKIYILHENEEWTDHLTKRLEELHLPYECWHLDHGSIDLTKEPPQGVFYNRMSASSHTRDHRFAPEFTKAVLSWLERHGRTVVNGSRALSLELSKVEQYMNLNQSGVTTPKTIAALGKDEIVKAAKQLNLFPFITKHNRAGKGQGVQLFHSIQALEKYVYGKNFEEPVDGITLIQQYIDAPKPYIIRHEFVGGKFLYAVKVDTSEGFELCPADACSIEDQYCPTGAESQGGAKFEILTEYHDPIIEYYEQFLKANSIEVAGIEAIQDQNGQVYTYDVNTNTNYNTDAEQEANIYGMLQLAKYLGNQLYQKSPHQAS